MILIIDNEIKIQGKPEECIEFLKKYREEFKEESPLKDILETPDVSPLDYNDWLHTISSDPVPGVKYTNSGCEDCLYYQHIKNNPLKANQVGDTPCTWCPKMVPICTSNIESTDPLGI